MSTINTARKFHLVRKPESEGSNRKFTLVQFLSVLVKKL